MKTINYKKNTLTKAAIEAAQSKDWDKLYDLGWSNTNFNGSWALVPNCFLKDRNDLMAMRAKIKSEHSERREIMLTRIERLRYLARESTESNMWTEKEYGPQEIAARQELMKLDEQIEKELLTINSELEKYENPILVDINQPIINLTQHAATAEQVEAGVVEPTNKAVVQSTLTFEAIPKSEEMAQRAELLATVAKESGCKKAMIGGAPFFMSALEHALLKVGVKPVYAFSVRDSVEQPDGNGGVRKVNVFKHVGFVEV